MVFQAPVLTLLAGQDTLGLGGLACGLDSKAISQWQNWSLTSW